MSAPVKLTAAQYAAYEAVYTLHDASEWFYRALRKGDMCWNAVEDARQLRAFAPHVLRDIIRDGRAALDGVK